MKVHALAIESEAQDWVSRRSLSNGRECETNHPNPDLPTQDTAILTRLSDIEPEVVSWLSPGRIPFGKITILEGNPALGKTMVLCDLAARVSTGRAFPEDPPVPASDVILLTGEDGLADTIRPRLDAAGADTTRIHAFEGIRRLDGNDTGITLPEDIGTLEGAVRRTSASLVIVDVLEAFLSPAVDSYRNQDVRRALVPLRDLAESSGAAIVLVRHLRKGSGSKAMVAGLGSIGVIGAARAALLVEEDPDDQGKRVLAVVKSNLGVAAPSLAYAIRPSEKSGAGRIEWLGVSPHSADSLTASRMHGQENPGTQTKISQAMAFLEECLAAGEVPKTEVIGLAKDEGFPLRTIERAAEKLGVISDRPFSGPATWKLPAVPSSPFSPTS